LPYVGRSRSGPSDSLPDGTEWWGTDDSVIDPPSDYCDLTDGGLWVGRNCEDAPANETGWILVAKIDSCCFILKGIISFGGPMVGDCNSASCIDEDVWVDSDTCTLSCVNFGPDLITGSTTQGISATITLHNNAACYDTVDAKCVIAGEGDEDTGVCVS